MSVGPLWSCAIPANETIEIEPDCDIQISNVALETTHPGRTVVKIHYIQEDFFNEDSSDEEDEDDDEAADDEDEEERAPKGEDVTVVLCSLYPEKLEQASVNFVLPDTDAYEIIVEGPNTVHLLGNYVYQGPDPMQDDYPYSDDDEDIDSELADSEGGLYDPETGLPMMLDSDEESFDADELEALAGEGSSLSGTSEDDDGDRFAEIAEQALHSHSKAKLNGNAHDATLEDSDEDEEMALDTSATAPALNGDTTKLSKKQRKKLAQKAKAAGQSEVQAVTAQKQEKTTISKDGKKTDEVKSASTVTATDANGKGVTATAKKQSKKVTLPDGVVVEDIKTGDGPAAKSGSKVSVRYIGKLKDGSVFDKNVKGKPFTFKIGKDAVIKGWHSGFEGIRPGGERKLTIPPSQAYGKSGTEGIPPNSVLTFEVKCLSIA